MPEKSPYLIEDMDMLLIPERCPDCGGPLHLYHDMPVCWECFTTRTNAHRGRTCLEKAKLAALGFTLGRDHTDFYGNAPL